MNYLIIIILIIIIKSILFAPFLFHNHINSLFANIFFIAFALRGNFLLINKIKLFLYILYPFRNFLRSILLYLIIESLAVSEYIFILFYLLFVR